MAFQFGVIFQDRNYIFGRRLRGALAVVFQSFHPFVCVRVFVGVVFVRVRYAVKIGVCGRFALFGKQAPYRTVGGGKIGHFETGRQAGNILHFAVFVVDAEKVYTHQVVGVAKLHTGRVGFVVAVGKFSLIAYQATGYRSFAVGVAAVRSGLFVGVL